MYYQFGRRPFAALISLALLGIGSVAGSGQVPRQAQSQQRPQQHQDEDDVIKLKTTLVQVPVVVSDPGGRYVTDLSRNDFELYEDGVPQTLTLFASIDEPFSVALLLDSSGSTADQLKLIKSSAQAFVDNLRERDRVMVISFDDSVHVQCELTGNREVLRRAIDSVQPGEFTQVYEAIYTGVWERLHDMQGRKAAIVFTDGIDTASSEIDQEDTLDAVLEAETVLVYPIRFNTRPDVERKLALRRPRPTTVAVKPEEDQTRALDRTYRAADQYLQALADDSGAIVERAETLYDLKAAFARIAEELRHQYLLGYYPTNGKTTTDERRITVRVSRPGLKVRARPSYRTSGS